jgi:hypothetical protein
MKIALAAFLILLSFDAMAMGKKASSSGSESVWIMRSDGAQSCKAKEGESLEEGAQELTSAKIRVIAQRKGSDGKMHPLFCGAPAGSTNSYQIQKQDLPQAMGLGYKQVP